MNLKQVSEAYNYLFQPNAFFGLQDRKGERQDHPESLSDSSVPIQPDQALTDGSSLSLTQAESLVPITVNQIEQTTRLQMDALLDITDLNLITPRYV